MGLRETADLGLRALTAPSSTGDLSAVWALAAAGASLAVLGSVVEFRRNLREVPRCSVLPTPHGDRALRRMGVDPKSGYLSLLDFNTRWDPEHKEMGDEYVTAVAAVNMPELWDMPNDRLAEALLDAYGFDTGKIRSMKRTVDVDRIDAPELMNQWAQRGVQCLVFSEKPLPLRPGARPLVPANCPTPLSMDMPVLAGVPKCSLAWPCAPQTLKSVAQIYQIDPSRDPWLHSETHPLPPDPDGRPLYVTRLTSHHTPELERTPDGLRRGRKEIARELLRAFELPASLADDEATIQVSRSPNKRFHPNTWTCQVLTDVPLEPR